MEFCVQCSKSLISFNGNKKYCSTNCKKIYHKIRENKNKYNERGERICSRCKLISCSTNFSVYCSKCSSVMVQIAKKKNNKLCLSSSRKYYLKNKDCIAFKEKRRKRFKEYDYNRRKTDNNYAIMRRLRNLFNTNMNKYCKEGKASKSSKYGINYHNIIEHLKPFPKDTSKYHIDHIRPLCYFDFNDPEEIKKAFAPKNHQWLTIKENLVKGKTY